MKNFLKNYWVAISFVVAFILDANYGILEHFIKDPFWLNIAKGIGALILAYNTGSKLKAASKEGEDPLIGNRPGDR